MSDAPHPRAPRLPWRHFIAAAVVALGLGGAVPLAPQTASATPQAATDLSPTDVGDGIEGQLSAEIVLHDGGVVAPGEDVKATVLLSNRTEEIASAGEISFHIDDETIDTRYDLTPWTENRTENQPETSTDDWTDQTFPDYSLGTEIFRQDVDQVHPGSTLEFTVTIPASATEFLNAASFGTRGMTLQWHTDGDVVAQGRSAFVWDAESLATPVTISPIVPIVTDLGEGGLLSIAELASLTAPEGDLTVLLDAVEGTSATLAIDPRLLVSIRALGSDAPEDAMAWLERLESLKNPSFALEFADASLTLQAQAGLEEPLEASGFSFATAEHEFFTEVQPTPAPTGTETPGGTTGTETPGSTTGTETDGAQNDEAGSDGTGSDGTSDTGADGTQTDSTANTGADANGSAADDAEDLGEEPVAPNLTDPGATEAADAADPASTDPTQTDPSATGEPDGDAANDTENEPVLEPRDAPDLEELLDFDYTRTDLSWPASGTVESLDALTGWGAETIVLDGGQAMSTDERSFTPSSQQQIDGTEVLITDETLDDAIANAVTAESTLDFQDATTDIAALLAVIAREAPNEAREIVTTLPREALDDPAYLGDLLDLLSTSNWTELDALPEQSADPSILDETELVPGSYADETITEFLDLETAFNRGEDLTALFADPAAATEELEVALLGTISNRTIQTSQWESQRAQFVEFATGVANEISIVGDSEIQLIGHESSLPLFIENTSDREVTVELRLRPTTGHLTVDEAVTVTIPAGGVTRASLPVQAIANGVSGVEATLWTTTNVQLNNTAEFVVNVNASLETVAVGILIGAGVLLFVIGIWRTIRRRTRDKAAEVEESSESEPASAESAEPAESSDDD